MCASPGDRGLEAFCRYRVLDRLQRDFLWFRSHFRSHLRVRIGHSRWVSFSLFTAPSTFLFSCSVPGDHDGGGPYDGSAVYRLRVRAGRVPALNTIGTGIALFAEAQISPLVLTLFVHCGFAEVVPAPTATFTIATDANTRHPHDSRAILRHRIPVRRGLENGLRRHHFGTWSPHRNRGSAVPSVLGLPKRGRLEGDAL